MAVDGRRPIVFGEVLFDCFPDGSEVLGGAPFNVAWHLHGFGESPLFISRVGNDPAGGKVRAAMAGWGMDMDGLQVDDAHPTGKVRITLLDGEPSYEIVPDQAYDHISAEDLPGMDSPAFIYHGSLALREPDSAHALDVLLNRHEVPVFLDVNLRPPWWDERQVRARLARARWLKLNGDELDKLAREGVDRIERVRALIGRYGLDLVILTLGSEGALAVGTADATVAVRPEAATRVVDTVGAGDAFASVLMLGLLRQWPQPLTLKRAQQFASSVVGLHGATVADPDFYRRHLGVWEQERAS